LDSLFNDRNTAGAPDEVLRRFTSRKDTKSGDIDVAYRGYSNIKFITVHRAKGLEADEVIVLNLVNDKYGFPNKIADDPLLNLLLADSDDYQYAEERRLFYVAMTRTRNRVYLITSHAEAYKGHSVFVDELLDDNGNEAIRLITEEGERAPTHCPRCGKGILVVRRNSMDGREFLGCTNYPFCEKTYPSTEVLRHQVKCPQCGGWMVKRSGRYGDFHELLRRLQSHHRYSLNLQGLAHPHKCGPSSRGIRSFLAAEKQQSRAYGQEGAVDRSLVPSVRGINGLEDWPLRAVLRL
jgi:ssDNA-binding Zn-finger/Zn-ribbon topoisomerase 1